MRSSFRGFHAAASTAVLLVFASGPALADATKDQCVDANGRGQQFRRENKLSAARTEFRTCASPSCPAIVRDDCARRLDELDKVQPTIVFELKDAAGSDVSGVKVTVDGKPLTDRLDGAALPVDMGEHVFGFEVPDQPQFTRTLIIAEGEKLRHERIALGGAGAPGSTPLLPPRSSSNEASAPSAAVTGSSTSEPVIAGGATRTQKTLGLVAAGAGIAAAALGAVFAGIASSQWTTAQRECPAYSECVPSAVAERDGAARSATVSTVSFIAGGILFATGMTLFLTAPKANRASVALTVGLGGVGLVGTL